MLGVVSPALAAHDPDKASGGSSWASGGGNAATFFNTTHATDANDATSTAWRYASFSSGAGQSIFTIPGGSTVVASLRVKWDFPTRSGITQGIDVRCGTGGGGAVLYSDSVSGTGSRFVGSSGRVDVGSPCTSGTVTIVVSDSGPGNSSTDCSASPSTFNCYLLHSLELYAVAVHDVPEVPASGGVEFWQLYWGEYDPLDSTVAVLGIELRDRTGEFGECDLLYFKTAQLGGPGGQIEYVDGDLHLIELDAVAGLLYEYADFEFADGAGQYAITCADSLGYIWAQRFIWVGVDLESPPPAQDGPIVDGREICGPNDPGCAVRQLGRDLGADLRQQTDELLAGIIGTLQGVGSTIGEEAEAAVGTLGDALTAKEPFASAIGGGGYVLELLGDLSAEVAASDDCAGLVLTVDIALMPEPDAPIDVGIAVVDPSEPIDFPLLRCEDFEQFAGSAEWQTIRTMMGAFVYAGFALTTLQSLRPRLGLGG